MLAGLLVATAKADVFVIVNAKNPSNVMSAVQIERLFLIKSKRFETGEPAEPVNQPEESHVREKFNEKVLGRNEAQLKYYWSRKMFAGSDRPPPIAGGDGETELFVAEHEGGIGYLSVLPKDPRVKLVLKISE